MNSARWTWSTLPRRLLAGVATVRRAMLSLRAGGGSKCGRRKVLLPAGRLNHRCDRRPSGCLQHRDDLRLLRIGIGIPGLCVASPAAPP
jgi:hypothetical protein